MIKVHPRKIEKPLNITDDGICVFSIWSDEVPKMEIGDILKINTGFGTFYLSKNQLENCERFEQIKYRPDEPMKMIRIKKKPRVLSEEEKERMRFDNYWEENSEFVNNLTI